MSGASIVIPAWNEASRLGRTLDRYLVAMQARGEPFEIIVVADGREDDTPGLARRYAEKGVRVLEFPLKLGKGGAVLAGFAAAKYDRVGFVDADGPVPEVELVEIIDLLDRYDCVVGSRWLPESHILRQERWPNVVAGRLWNILTRTVLLVPVRDTQCGVKFLRRSTMDSALRAVSLTNRAFDVDLLYHVRKAGGRILEYPVTWRHDPESRMPIARAVPLMLLSLLAVRLMNLPGGRRVPTGLVRWFHGQWGTV
ncbi:MAG: glycosyltransferase [Thermoplasmata archaeon]|nr:glycosyltransferase [Thermoplasmata archaeon]